MKSEYGILGFLCGSLALLWLPRAGLPYALSVTLLLIMVGILVAIRRGAFVLLVMALLLAVSYLRVMDFVQQVDQVQSQKIHARIQIVQVLKQGDYQTAIAELSQPLGELPQQARLYLTWQSETPLQLQAHYQAELLLRPLTARLNSGNFNRQRWLMAQHIVATATVKKATLVKMPPTIRSRWLTQAYQQSEGLPTQGLLLALAFGERAWLNSAHWQLFQQTATAHLIAISGLHIALAMGIGFWLMKGVQWVVLSLMWRYALWRRVLLLAWLPYAAGWLIAFGYCYLAGFAIPTLRALFAISAWLLLHCARRHWTAWQLWLRVVALLIIGDPLVLLSDSFWLSVLAVAALIAWYQFLPLSAFISADFAQKLPKLPRLWLKGLLGLLHLQCGISLLFAPAQLYFFDGFTPLSLPANLLVVPLYSFLLVPLILLALLLLVLLGDGALWLWQWADSLAQFSLHALTPLSGSWLALDRLQQGQSMLFCAALFSGLLMCRKRYWGYYALYAQIPLLLAVSGAILPILQKNLKNQPLARWIHLDVGQGLAMLLVYREQQQQKAVIFDSGASWQGGSMAQIELIPYLKREGIEPVALFVSHDDNDHAGGVADLLGAYPQVRLISAGQKSYADKFPEACEQGKQWQFGQLHFEAFAPPKQQPRAKNADSCVLSVQIGQYRLLLTGDTNAEQERLFAKGVGQVDFLQVPHHGSKSSTSYTLLAQLKPKVAVISTSRWNPWHLPHFSVEQRLHEQGIATFNTAQTGMVEVQIFADSWQIHRARTETSAWYEALLGKK